MIMKNDLEELVREKLKLPDTAVIKQASFKITAENDDIQITGNTQVEFLNDVLVPESDRGPALVETKTRGRKIKALKVAPLKKAVEGKGNGITDAQIKGWKAILHSRKYANLLTDNQLEALKSIEGIRVNKMTPEMRQQVKDILDNSSVEARAARGAE